MPPGSFPTTLPFTRLECRPHTRRKCYKARTSPSARPFIAPSALASSRPKYPEPLVPVSPAPHAPLCAAPPPLRLHHPLSVLWPLRFHHAPSAPEFLHPPLGRFFSRSSEFFPASDQRFRYVSIHSYTLSAQPRKRSAQLQKRVIDSGCEKGMANYKDGVEIRCAWLMERENHGGNNRAASERSRIG